MQLPRGLVVLAALWIAGSWMLCLGPHAPLHPTIAGFTPGVRLLVACLGAGVCAAWPLLRLAGPRERWPIRRVLIDFVTVATMLQVVLWPLRLTTAWAPTRLALIDAQMLAWALLAAAMVAPAIASASSGVRTRAMLGCLLVTAIGVPVELGFAWAGASRPQAWMLGPVLGPLRLTTTDAVVEARHAWPGVGIVLALAALGWGLVWRSFRPRGPVARATGER